jgi:hypothetical protein
MAALATAAILVAHLLAPGTTASAAPPTTRDEVTTSASTSTSTTTSPPVAATTAPPATGALRQAAAPRISVTPTSGLLPGGGSAITVTGSGFDPVKNNKVGVYVVFGPIDPGTFFKDANRFLAAVWVHPGASGAGQAELRADGSFTVTLPPPGGQPLTATYVDGNGARVDCRAVGCKVATMAAHGLPDRSQDAFASVSFAAGGTTAGTSGGSGATTTLPRTPTSGATPSTGSATTAAPAGPNASAGDGAGPTLAATGRDVFTPTALALVLLATGLVLVEAQGRRQLRAAGHTRRRRGNAAPGEG